jgi:hypothetical protein
MALLALVTALPQLLHYRSFPGVFIERARALGILESQSGWLSEEAARTGASQLELLGDQFRRAALAFNATTDTGTSYGAFVPFVSFLFGVLALLGLILALIRLRQIRYSVLPIWVGVTVVFAGALLLNPPDSRRFIIAMPAVSLLAAIALNELAGAAGSVQPERDGLLTPEPSAGTKSALALILLLVPIAIAVYETAFYFGTYRHEHRFGDRNTEIADAMAKHLQGTEGDWIAHFYGPPGMYVSFPTLSFLATGFREGANLFDVPEGGAPSPGYDTKNQLFFFLPERHGEIESLRATYPSGTEEAFSGYYADPLFFVYEVRAAP